MLTLRDNSEEKKGKNLVQKKKKKEKGSGRGSKKRVGLSAGQMWAASERIWDKQRGLDAGGGPDENPSGSSDGPTQKLQLRNREGLGKEKETREHNSIF